MIRKTNWAINVDDDSISFKDRMFKSRSLTEAELNLSISDVHDYIDINDIDTAVFEIRTAIVNKKSIIIIGDYDVDGVFSTTELLKFFRLIGYNVSYYIPDRIKEGYGISDTVADKIIKSKKFDLVITVDNGIAAISQIQRIVDAGIRVVVTDHHECKKQLPPAHAVIDCKRPDNAYPFKELCGAGIVLKLIQALCDEFGLLENTWTQFIEYAAIATIADVVPLVDENRIIVDYGLKQIRKTKDIAILNLLRVAEKLENLELLSADDIAYYIAPLVNAASRVGTVDVAMGLMLTESSEQAIYFADELKKLNEKRKEIEASILKEANEFLIQHYNFESVNPIVVYGNDWHLGVIGIVASRLVDMYSKPVIVLSKDTFGVYHGSCRTYRDLSIMDLLNYAEDFMTQFGGHASAAGLSLTDDQLRDFIDKLNEFAQNNYSHELFMPLTVADMSVKLDEITLDNYKYVEVFSPFGQDNPDPIFVVKKVKVKSVKKIGQKEGFENAHLKITVADLDSKLSTKVIEGIGFFKSEFADLLMPEDIVDIMFKPSINYWQGQETPQMQILDIHCDIYQKEGVSDEENILYLEDEVSIAELASEYELSINEYIPCQEECFEIYKALSNLIAKESSKVLITDLDILSLIISSKIGREYISPFKLIRAIEVLTEACYFNYKKMLFGKIILSMTNTEPKRITETNAYMKLEEEKEYSYD